MTIGAIKFVKKETVPTPVITGTNPSQPTARPAKQWITIKGTGFVSDSTVTLRIGSSTYPIPSDRTEFKSSTQIRVRAGLTDPGTWTARVTNPGNRISNLFSFTVKQDIPSPVHDMTVTDVYTSPSSPNVGQSTTIHVTVKNEGRQQENYVPVKAYVDGYQVSSAQVTLLDGKSTTKSFTWTPSTAKTYSVKGEVGIVSGETETSDNEKTINVIVAMYNPKLIIPIYTPTFQKAHAGTTVTYIIRVTNEGTAKDTIKLSLSGDLEWDLHLSETSVTLAPGESTDVYLYLTIGQQIDTKRITITGTSKGDISKTSSCTVLACNIGEGHGLFAVTLFFKKSDTRDHKLNFNVPDYVKISDKTITLSPSGGKWINVVFDPKSSISFWFNIEVADITSGESVKIPVEFPEYYILTTTFDMAMDSYSFKNPIGLFCYGMSETSILYFKTDGIPLPFERQDTYSLSKFEAMPNIFSHQRFFKESFFASLYQKFIYVDEAEEYDYLVKNIVYDCPMILGLQDPGVLGTAHAVVVYKIIVDPDADKAYIFIYDNEYPYDMSSDSFFDAFPYAVYNKASQKFTFGTYNKFLALDAKKLPLENIPVILILACPVNITLIDQYGRTISDNGTNEIPGAGIIILDNTKRFYLPTNLTYSAEIDAYDAGLFNFTRVSPVGNNFSLTAFENISVTASTKAFVEIAQNVTNYTMKIDYNGDGHIDEEKSPDVNETIEMNQPPIASFTYSPLHPIVNQSITFNASSSHDPDGNITNYKWNFGDGNITNTTDPIITHTYVSAGNYTVNLTVTDDEGEYSYTESSITIKEPIKEPVFYVPDDYRLTLI